MSAYTAGDGLSTAKGNLRSENQPASKSRLWTVSHPITKAPRQQCATQEGDAPHPLMRQMTGTWGESLAKVLFELYVLHLPKIQYLYANLLE